MRQGCFSSWLTDFVDQEYKTVIASYLDDLKKIIESKSTDKKKYATIQDALVDFCTRLNLPVPDLKQAYAGNKKTLEPILAALEETKCSKCGYNEETPMLYNGKLHCVMCGNEIHAATDEDVVNKQQIWDAAREQGHEVPSLFPKMFDPRLAFNKEDIDKAINQGTPAVAIANEFGNSEEEKQTIIDYVEGKEEKQRQENSQIARDMKLSDDIIKPMSPGVQINPKMSSIRSLSSKRITATNKVTEKDTSFLKKETVNGIEISVGWDEGYNDYTIYFPQIVLSEEMQEKGVWDQVLRISDNPKDAETIFNYARKLASQESNPSQDTLAKIYKTLEPITRALQ